MPVKRKSASGVVEITTVPILGFAANEPRYDAGSVDSCHYDASEQLLAGQYYDEESQLHWNWHRYYDPSKGRYITSDPIGLNGGINTYGYAYQNPLKYVDTNGLNPGVAYVCAVNPAACATALASLVYAAAEAVSGIASAVSGMFGSESSSPEDCDNYHTSEPGDDGGGLGPDGTVNPLANSSPVPAASGGGWGPEGPDDDKNLTPQQRKSIRSLEKQIKKHEQKLKDFKANPTVRPGMENQPAHVIEAQHARRIRLSLIHI